MTKTHSDLEHSSAFAARLQAFAQANPVVFGSGDLLELATEYADSPKQHKDAVSTTLMGVYSKTLSKEAFALIYELNHDDFLRLTYHHLKRSYYHVDAADVLQEVFFNVFRYPHNFKPERKSAFRNWTHSIIRNTALKHSRRAQRNHATTLNGISRIDDDEMQLDFADDRAINPLEHSAEHEETEDLVRAWRLYLHYYLHAYRCLTPREKRVLYLVEVDNLPYREAADKVEVRVENLKMMVFRARRKIFTIMKRKFQTSQDACDRRVVADEPKGEAN